MHRVNRQRLSILKATFWTLNLFLAADATRTVRRGPSSIRGGTAPWQTDLAGAVQDYRDWRVAEEDPEQRWAQSAVRMHTQV